MQSRVLAGSPDLSGVYVLRVRSTGRGVDWSRWLTGQMRACGFGSDEALAHAIGVSNTTVHRWRKGSHPEVTQLRQLVEPLRTDLRTLLVVSGTLTEREIGGRAGRVDPVNARELLELDPSLNSDARRILLAAYDAAASTVSAPAAGASRRTARSAASTELRAVARDGQSEDRAEVRRLARKAREQHEKDQRGKDDV